MCGLCLLSFNLSKLFTERGESAGGGAAGAKAKNYLQDSLLSSIFGDVNSFLL